MEAESILYDVLEKMGSGGEIKRPEEIWSLLDIYPQLTSDYQLILIEQLEKIARSLLHNSNLMLSVSQDQNDVLNRLTSLALNSEETLKLKILSLIEFLS